MTLDEFLAAPARRVWPKGADRMNADEIVKHVSASIRTGFPPSAHRATAKAAILATLEAIREPSEAMIDEGSAEMAKNRGYQDDYLLKDDARESYVAMIDALKREVAG